MTIRKGTTYFCEMCGEDHPYVVDPRPDAIFSDLTEKEKAQRKAASTWGWHRRYEKSTEIAASLRHLRQMIKPGDTVHTILRHRARSGMMRHISLMVVMKTGAVHDISGYAADVLGMRRADSGGIKVGGCGMDMGFHLVYSLSQSLFPKFTCIGENCPSNDHVNGDRSRKVGHYHSDGGYALTHRWM